jgi:hypothetical protein
MYILRLLVIYSPIWGSGGLAIGKEYSFLEPIASEFWESRDWLKNVTLFILRSLGYFLEKYFLTN